jgi:TonB family protein
MTPQASRIAERLTFVNIVAPIEAPQKPRARLKVPELPRKELRPEPLPKVEHTEIQPLAPKPVFPEAPPTPKPVRRAPETVTVGAFNTPAPQARVPDPIRMVQATGFDDPSPRQPSPELKIGNAKVGAFQSAAAADVRSSPVRGSDTVADAGFAPVGTAQKQQPVARAIGDSGFGDAKAGERRTEPARVAQVQSGVFGNAEPTPQPRRATPSPERVETPVEIIVKPTPEYTKEARSQKIEGEVLLEVEFRASGEVRVLRVVRGLGYGLDESATRAAERIQFKPARSSKGPVDFRATVQIVFRLT